MKKPERPGPGFGRRLTIALLLALAVWFAPQGAAAFGDCNDPAYVGGFVPGDTETPRYFDCVVRTTLPFRTADGAHEARIFHHLHADWSVEESDLANLDRTLEESLAAVERMGGIRMKDISILVYDGVPPDVHDPSDAESGMLAWTIPEDGPECRITVFVLAVRPPGADAGLDRHIVSHELFHCVQQVNLPVEMTQTGNNGDGDSGDWWIEGSAEWFAAFAGGSPRLTQDRVAGFDTNSATLALHQLAYTAAPFFFWLHDQVGPEGILPFLRGMASSPDAPAQIAAMQRALPNEDWQRFARAYLDGAIRHPRGLPLEVNPAPGESWSFDASGSRSISATAFQIHRGQIALECGRWDINSSRPDSVSIRDPDASWRAVPAEIDRSGGGDPLRFAVFSTGNAASSVTIDVVHRAGCDACAGVTTLDQCLIGDWQVVSGVEEWLARNVPGMTFSGLGMDPAYYRLNADGTFEIGNPSVDATASREGVTGRGVGAGHMTGRWSAAGGQLNLCPATQQYSGEVTIDAPGGRLSMPVMDNAVQQRSQPYRCAGDAMSTEMAIPRMPPVTYELVRRSP